MLEDMYPGPVTYKKVTLERPQRFGTTVHITDELAIDDSGPYLFELAQQRLVEDFETAITLRATSLYSYARFEGDCDLERAKILYAARVESYPVAFRDYVFMALFRWVKKLVQRVSKKRFFLHQFPRWLCPRIKHFEVLEWTEKKARVERIQEALLAQIYMLKRLKLKPQAVLASPDIMGDLMAYQTEHHRAEMHISENWEFVGLPVIMCPELIQGAIVV